MFSDSPDSESLQAEREMWDDIARTDRTTCIDCECGAGPFSDEAAVKVHRRQWHRDDEHYGAVVDYSGPPVDEAGLLCYSLGGFPAGTLVRWVSAESEGWYLAIRVILPDGRTTVVHSDDVVSRRDR